VVAKEGPIAPLIPIDQYRLAKSGGLDFIKRAISTPHAKLIIAETGSGKTTMLARLFAELGEGDTYISIPTRPACIEMVHHLNSDRPPSEHLFGYRIQGEAYTPPKCRVTFVTTGWLYEKFNDKNFTFENIVMDEAHEQTIDAYLVFKHLRELRKIRRFNLIICSATISERMFRRDFPDLEVFDEDCSSGHKKDVRFHSNDGSGVATDPEELAMVLQDIQKQSPWGNKLAIVEGESVINAVLDILRKNTELEDVRLLRLYSGLDREEQGLVFEKTDKPMIVVATNIVESSITLHRLTHVVVSGLHKSMYIDEENRQELRVDRDCKSNVLQKAGRAGRLQVLDPDGNPIPSWTLVMMREETFNELDEMPVRDLDKQPLYGPIMKLVDSKRDLELYLDDVPRVDLCRDLKRLLDWGLVSGPPLPDVPAMPDIDKVVQALPAGPVGAPVPDGKWSLPLAPSDGWKRCLLEMAKAVSLLKSSGDELERDAASLATDLLASICTDSGPFGGTSAGCIQKTFGAAIAVELLVTMLETHSELSKNSKYKFSISRFSSGIIGTAIADALSGIAPNRLKMDGDALPKGLLPTKLRDIVADLLQQGLEWLVADAVTTCSGLIVSRDIGLVAAMTMFATEMARVCAQSSAELAATVIDRYGALVAARDARIAELPKPEYTVTKLGRMATKLPMSITHARILCLAIDLLPPEMIYPLVVILARVGVNYSPFYLPRLKGEEQREYTKRKREYTVRVHQPEFYGVDDIDTVFNVYGLYQQIHKEGGAQAARLWMNSKNLSDRFFHDMWRSADCISKALEGLGYSFPRTIISRKLTALQQVAFNKEKAAAATSAKSSGGAISTGDAEFKSATLPEPTYPEFAKRAWQVLINIMPVYKLIDGGNWLRQGSSIQYREDFYSTSNRMPGCREMLSFSQRIVENPRTAKMENLAGTMLRSPNTVVQKKPANRPPPRRTGGSSSYRGYNSYGGDYDYDDGDDYY
jgi:hypothetical protein